MIDDRTCRVQRAVEALMTMAVVVCKVISTDVAFGSGWMKLQHSHVVGVTKLAFFGVSVASRRMVVFLYVVHPGGASSVFGSVLSSKNIFQVPQQHRKS